MVCKSCGKQVQATDKFCPFCGTPSPAVPEPPVDAAPQSTPVNQAGAAPAGNPSGVNGGYRPVNTPPSNGPKYSAPKKSGKSLPLPLMIGGAAAAVVLVVLLIVLIVSGQPSAKVASALSATGKELTKMADTLSLPDLGKVLTKESASHNLDVEFTDGELEGLGVQMLADVNLGKHEVGFKATPYFGEVELCNLMVTAKEENVYFGLPELFPDPYYGFSTVTLMEDLENLGADVGDFDEVSFNIFDVIDLVEKETEEGTKEAQKAVDDALAELVKSLEVEKDGKKSIRVNGTNTKCAHYKVTVPEDAVEDVLKAYEDFLNATDMEAIVELVCDTMGLPSDVEEDILWELGYSEITLDGAFDLLDEIGDLELDVYISGGKISAVEYEGEIYGTDMEAGLYIGGGDNYIDDISIVLKSDYSEITLESSGNHTGKGGTFTDETVLSDGYDEFVLITEYETKGDRNLYFCLEMDGETGVELEGQYQVKGDNLVLNLEELNLFDEMTMSLSYTISGYKRNVKENKPVMLSKLDEDDLMDIGEEVVSNAEDLLDDLIDEIPELEYFFYYYF